MPPPASFRDRSAPPASPLKRKNLSLHKLNIGFSRLPADAYDNALGVTSTFNLNTLVNVNRLLGTDFDVRNWQHRGFYNATMGRIEMHLEARQPVSVNVRGAVRKFAQGERIHTENSYKYAPEQFRTLLIEAGFKAPQLWQDERQDFNVFYAAA